MTAQFDSKQQTYFEIIKKIDEIEDMAKEQAISFPFFQTDSLKNSMYNEIGKCTAEALKEESKNNERVITS